MQADEPEHFIIEKDRDHQQRPCSQTLRKKAHLMIEFRRRRVIQSNRFFDVEVLSQRGRVDRDAGVQTRRHGFIGAPFMADT